MYKTRTWKTKLLKGEMSNLMLDVLSILYVHQIYCVAKDVCRKCEVKRTELTGQAKSVWPTFTNKQTKKKQTKHREGSLLFLLACGVAGGGDSCGRPRSRLQGKVKWAEKYFKQRTFDFRAQEISNYWTKYKENGYTIVICLKNVTFLKISHCDYLPQARENLATPLFLAIILFI
jgi:hypothetical protein